METLVTLDNSEDSIQSNITQHNFKIAQFRVLWKISNYMKVQESVKHPNYIQPTKPVTVIPGTFTCGLQFYPNGDHESPSHSAVYMSMPKQKERDMWIQNKYAILNSKGEEEYVKDDTSIDLFNSESSWGHNDWFPVPLPNEDSTQTLLSNGCLQIVIEGTAWTENPVKEDVMGETFLKDSPITLSNLYKTQEQFTDAIISIGEDKFQVHKCILAVKSAFFEQLFKKQTQNIVVIQDVTISVFKEILHFLYTGTVTANITTMLPEVLQAARKFQLCYLKEICQIQMAEKICASNALSYLRVSQNCQANTLKEKTLQFILQNKKEIIKEDSWEEFVSHPNDELVMELLKRLMLQD